MDSKGRLGGKEPQESGDMRMVEAGEIGEAGHPRSPEVSRDVWAGATRSPSAGLEELLATLSRRLLALPADAVEPAVQAALETLGCGLDADRVRVYLPSSNGEVFEQAGIWTQVAVPGQLGSWRIDLSAQAELGRRLRAGESLWLPRLDELFASASLDLRSSSAIRSPRRWRSAWGATLLVPCAAASRLLAFFVVEGERSRGTERACVMRRLELAGGQLASFLERHRLTTELEASRARRLHDERLETLGRVASSVAHDLNNVLTAIVGYGELLELELAEGAAGHAELAEIQAAAARATGLVDQVLGFGRRRPGGVAELDLNARVGQLSGMIERLLGAHVELSLDLVDEALPIRVDPVRLEQVLLNLASNARDAVAEGERRTGRFELTTRMIRIAEDGRDPEVGGDALLRPSLPAGRYLRLSARDDGCGIEPAIALRLFEPFFTTKRGEAGTGLGLATTAEVLDEASGGIALESARGQGACFHLYFPLAQPRPLAVGSAMATPGYTPPCAPD